MNYAQHNSESYLKLCTHSYILPTFTLKTSCLVEMMLFCAKNVNHNSEKKVPEGKMKNSKLKRHIYVACVTICSGYSKKLQIPLPSYMLHANMIPEQVKK